MSMGKMALIGELPSGCPDDENNQSGEGQADRFPFGSLDMGSIRLRLV